MNKYLFRSLAVSLISFSLIVTGCSSESETSKAARLLYEEAQASNLDGEPTKALVLLDSLKSNYPTETKWQREAMKLRPTVIIAESEMQINLINDSISWLEEEYNRILPKMKKISDPRLVEPYYVSAATYTADFMDKTGIQPRVSEIGQFYLVTSVNGLGLKHTGCSLTYAGETATAGPIPFDGELNYRIEGGEVVTYSPEQSEAIGKLASQYPGESMTLTITGSKNKSIKLSGKEVTAIANCYNFSKAIVEARQLAFERERLNRQIEIARNQGERLNKDNQQ